jgi:hypothetical protein
MLDEWTLRAQIFDTLQNPVSLKITSVHVLLILYNVLLMYCPLFYFAGENCNGGEVHWSLRLLSLSFEGLFLLLQSIGFFFINFDSV